MNLEFDLNLTYDLSGIRPLRFYIHTHAPLHDVSSGVDTGRSNGALDFPSRNFNIARSRYSNRAVTLIKQSQH